MICRRHLLRLSTAADLSHQLRRCFGHGGLDAILSMTVICSIDEASILRHIDDAIEIKVEQDRFELLDGAGGKNSLTHH